MRTEFGRQLKAQFPDLEVEEDVFSDTHYWLTLHYSENSCIVIEVFSEGGFGVSNVDARVSDFSGHDTLCNTPSEVFKYMGDQLGISAAGKTGVPMKDSPTSERNCPD